MSGSELSVRFTGYNASSIASEGYTAYKTVGVVAFSL